MDQPLTYATFWRRLSAGVIDLLLGVAFTMIFGSIAASSKTTAYVLLPLMWGTMLLYTVVLHAKLGATLGKLTVGIRVTCIDGNRISWGRSIARSAVDLIFTAYWLSLVVPATFSLPPEAFRGQSWGDLFQTVKQSFPASYETAELFMGAWFWSEFLTMLCNSKRRAVHDFIAGTVVVAIRGTPNPSFKRTPDGAT